MAMVSCARPSSYEPFVVREKAEYGDTYIFNLDLSDSAVSYGLDFYTRLERPAFGTFPADSISLEIDIDKDIVKQVFMLAEKYGKPVYAVVSNMRIAVERMEQWKK